MKLKAPFPWFGGKSRVADLVWSRLGDCSHYIEPFFGSGAVLLARPHSPGYETVNDADGYVANFWRALQHAPDEVAHWADYPVFENDLHARHIWLAAQKADFTARLEGDPAFYDAKVAGWWVWGICCWIAGGWCSPGIGPWISVDGKAIKQTGQGVKRQLPHLGNTGQGVKRTSQNLHDYLWALAERLRNAVVCCGDWSRICGPAVLFERGTPVGIFLDPPYAPQERDSDCYATDATRHLAADVRDWAVEWGHDPRCRIALCGYEGEHTMPDDWECIPWKANGGYANRGNKRGRNNKHRERVWFSPHCTRDAGEQDAQWNQARLVGEVEVNNG
jgi:site-specific DNA-adenine methylase